MPCVLGSRFGTIKAPGACDDFLDHPLALIVIRGQFSDRFTTVDHLRLRRPSRTSVHRSHLQGGPAIDCASSIFRVHQGRSPHREQARPGSRSGRRPGSIPVRIDNRVGQSNIPACNPPGSLRWCGWFAAWVAASWVAMDLDERQRIDDQDGAKQHGASLCGRHHACAN